MNSKYIDTASLLRSVAFGYAQMAYVPRVEKVVYNDPATIVVWSDGTKTVVKCHEGDRYDPEKGFLLCCAKKLFGNKGRYNDVMRKHVPQPDPCEIRVGSKVYRMVSE